MTRVVSLLEVDAWVVACVLVVGMAIAAELGLRAGHRAPKPGTSSPIDLATVSLFGLVLAFSFGAAAGKYDRRLWLLVNEATAIGDFAGSASVLEEPDRSELTQELVEYADVRIAGTLAPAGTASQKAHVQRARALQEAMMRTVAHAIHEQNAPSTHHTLVATMNETTTAFENSQTTLYDHIPSTILVMLLVSALVGAFSVGRQQGTMGGRGLPEALFIVLVALVVYTIVDLEQPTSGTARVPVRALESVRSVLPR
jgi:hypothetical protein